MCPPVAVNSQRKVIPFPLALECSACHETFYVGDQYDLTQHRLCFECVMLKVGLRDYFEPPPRTDSTFWRGLWNAFLILLVLGGIFAISWLACLQAWKWVRQ